MKGTSQKTDGWRKGRAEIKTCGYAIFLFAKKGREILASLEPGREGF
jgi:hypothetical protein